jgi:carbamoyl-phosphate synthase small subunit
MKALLMLEDGWSCTCESFTGPGEVFGELVFNTGLTGYQEVITDPSYHGQIVLMTSTQIGNYGIREHEDESMRIFTEGFVVREYSGEKLDATAAGALTMPEGYPVYGQSEKQPGSDTSRPTSGLGRLGIPSETTHNSVYSSLSSYLCSQNVLGVDGVDTRELTRHIREKGSMTAGITTETMDEDAFHDKVKAAPKLEGRNLVKEVAAEEPYLYSDGKGPRIVVLDCGIKISSLRELALRGCRVEVFPAGSSKKDILAAKPDGMLLSNGPGDPAAVPEVVSLVQELLGEVPIFGICLGHQMIGQALGAKTFKLKFGHHGGNHPVRHEQSRKVYITTQNHGFNVDDETLTQDDIEVTFVNLNDHTIEGLKHRTYPLFSVQFHPEAGPGPHDTLWLFDEFLEMVKKH